MSEVPETTDLVAVTGHDVSQIVVDEALPFAADQLADLLNEIAETGTIWSSCKRLGIATSTYLRARTSCKQLAKLHDAALAAYADKLRMTLHQRAVEGVEKGVYFQGQCVGTERQYSDRLLELLVKRHDPSFKDKVEHNHQHGGGVLVIHAPAGKALTTDQWHDKAKQVERIVEHEEPRAIEPGGGADGSTP